MLLSHLLFLLFFSAIFNTLVSQTFSHGFAPSHQPLSAAAPLLKARPFLVVWNMPTEQCQSRHNIDLELGDFDIVENTQQRFQGQRMTIFYRDRLGKYPYLSRSGEAVNGGLPQLGELQAHLSLERRQISRLLKPNFSGLAVIDWEEWQPLWERNFGARMQYRKLSKQLVRQQYPDLSEEATVALARKQFEESTRKFMEETLKAAVRERPKGFWGFYGYPFCFNKHKRKSDKVYSGRCHRGARQQNDQLSWLWFQSTTLYPSIYLPQRLAGDPDAALMVRHRLLEALRVASVWRHDEHSPQAIPVLPYARLAFIHSLNFLNKTDLEHTLGESAALGAAGVVLWGELKFAKSKRQCILLRDYLSNVLGPFIRSLRSTTQHCSLHLCHGNGRCARRYPGSGEMLMTYIPVSPEPQDTQGRAGSSSARPLQQHFVCQCYPGWRGKQCQERQEEDIEVIQ